MMEIDENQDNDCREENQQNNRFQLESNDRVCRPKDERRQHFNSRILPGDRFLARTALATQQQIADNRNVVIRLDRFVAFRTARVRKHHRFFCRKPGDTDIQKTTDDQAEKDDENVGQQYRDLDRHRF